MVNLKQCPFCGGDAQLISGGPGNHFIKCTSCSATSDDRSLDSTIKAWNLRAHNSYSAEPVAEFQAWWANDGYYYDPDTSDVPWFDKRGGLAEYAFLAGSASALASPPAKEVEIEKIGKLLDDLIEEAEWKGMNEQIGYAAGDPKADEDKKSVTDARNAVLAALRAHNSDSAEPVAWRTRVNYFGRSGWEYADNEQALIDKGLHNREPLYPTSTLAEPVAVKPLEWHSYCWNSQTTLLAKPWSADCLTYEVKEIVGSGWGLSVALGSFVFYQSKQEAIDAAQSDYERRILDFLVPSHKAPTTWVKWIEQAGAGRTAGFEVVSRDEDGAIAVYEHRPLYLASPPAKEVDLFELVRVAYFRGYQWCVENPDSPEYVAKAAYDYADKTTSALTNRTPDDEVGNG